MRLFPILLLAGCVSGCASQPVLPAVSVSVPKSEEPVQVRRPAYHVIETAYYLRDYLDPNDPSLRHESHSVYRATRVPASIDGYDVLPRTTVSPPTYVPLPPSEELAAELATQKQLTAELRILQSNTAAVEAQAKAQYAKLVSQTTDAINLRRELEVERARITPKTEGEIAVHPANAPINEVPAGAASTTEPKW